MDADDRKVLCVGLCCLDIVMVCETYPKEDSDQRCLSHKWQRGGNASNNSTIFAEFGIPCEILGTMSTDIGGQFMKKDFKLHNISFENCHFYDEFESPTSVIWINSQNGSRTIVHSNKNMPEITFGDFKVLNLENYKWIHFECRPYFKEIKTIIEYVRQWNSNENNNQIKISIEIEKPRLELMEMLSLGDVVFISKDFASVCGYTDMASAVEVLCHFLRPGRYGSCFCVCAQSFEQDNDLKVKFVEFNNRIFVQARDMTHNLQDFLLSGSDVAQSTLNSCVVISNHLGQSFISESDITNFSLKGVLICAWGDQGACAKTDEGPVHISKAYAPSKIINTLGAGDTFVAAIIISLIKGEKLCDAIHIGCKVAGTKCGMHDTKGLAQLCPYLL